MAVNSIGDMAQSFMLRRLTTRMEQDANTAAQELTTGYSADIGRKLGGDLTRFAGIEASLSRLTGYRVATDFAAIMATAMQAVFGQIDALTSSVGTSLLNAANAATPQAFDGLVKDASQRFDAVLTSLNAKVGDRTLFAGTATDGPAVASSNTILSALETAVTGAGAVTAAEIETAVAAWFNDPGGFESIGYLGNTDTASVSISEEDRVVLGFTAVTPAIRNSLKSLAMIALVDRNTAVSDADIGAQVVHLAATALLQNDSDRAYLAGDLGFTQARIEQAKTRNEAETSALQLARSDLVAVDPYEAATRLEAAQTQLETLYSVTARLSRLKLVDYLG